jgi:hypothetical protein
LSLLQTYTGRHGYFVELEYGPDRLIVAVEYQAEGVSIHGLLDTAARWGIFPAGLAEGLGYDPEADGEPIVISTRLGRYSGYLMRIPIVLLAQEGEELQMDLAWFVSSEWAGPPILGWTNCLERLRVAIDPSPGAGCFYFAEAVTSPDL